MDCWSHISLFEGTNITCQLVSTGFNLEDDEDEDYDEIQSITACKLGENTKKCVEELGDTLSSKDLNPYLPITLTVLLKRGHRIVTELDLKKIIKPKSPHIYNVTLNQDEALVQVQIPYQSDYLTVGDLRFQIQLWSEKTNLTRNMSSASMSIGLDNLDGGTQYHVKVRAVPWDYFQGSWSEWSHAVTFTTPTVETRNGLFAIGGTSQNRYVHLWSIIPAAVVVVSVVFTWKNKILTYIWPSIPHPKTTLMQICGPNNGLLLIYKPEEFSSLNVHSNMSSSTGLAYGETEPMLSVAGTEESPSCPTPSTDASLSSSSVRTEELELLSQSSSEGEPDVPKEALPIQNTVQHVEAPETPPLQHSNIQHERDDSYVTMSSFYQIKTVGTDNKSFVTNWSAT
ncbi:interleukin-7 receptor subunit alpha isoform X2 [Boleophthalmus pectinirostris]|uniref:interleukin-7 receptor subunit alpha isoform X2 n=1 Tax=Boleophthalmus pectinirostris TaxID=150288 RepID=UPI00242C01E7|nr:interleukin-7 receptor subunit alpha isoform X2 [Boleophthalmus pectinirostris]